MKKRVVILLIALVTIISLFGCSSTIEPINKEVTVETEDLDEATTYTEYGDNVVSKGNYFLFGSISTQTYIDFLDDLDENIYEIIDIDICQYETYLFKFFVTYKKIA